MVLRSVVSMLLLRPTNISSTILKCATCPSIRLRKDNSFGTPIGFNLPNISYSTKSKPNSKSGKIHNDT